MKTLVDIPVETPMEKFCLAFENIQWGYYTLALILVYALGALWYSKLIFGNTWITFYRPESIDENYYERRGLYWPMFYQFFTTVFFTLIVFLTTQIDLLCTILLSLAFIAWQKGALSFKYGQINTVLKVAVLELGYLFCSLLIIIILASL